MWQRFTERARKTVFYAQEEAAKFGDGQVRSEHLLLGLVRDPDSLSARVLEKLGVSLTRISAEVEKPLPRGEARPSQDMTLTPRAKRVIDLAYDEARNLNNNYIGTEHLLLGLIREGDGLAGRVLAQMGLELQMGRREVMIFQGAEPGGSLLPTFDDVKRFSARPYNPAPYFHMREGIYVAEHLFLMLVADHASDSYRIAKTIYPNLAMIVSNLERVLLAAPDLREYPPAGRILDLILAKTCQHAIEAKLAVPRPRHLLLAVVETERTLVNDMPGDQLESLRAAVRHYKE